jgi:hypothetical protein
MTHAVGSQLVVGSQLLATDGEFFFQVKEEDVVFDLLLKTKRGATEEHFKAEVQRTVDGAWSLKHINAQ